MSAVLCPLCAAHALHRCHGVLAAFRLAVTPVSAACCRRHCDGMYPSDMARRWLAAMHNDAAHNATWGLFWATQPGPDEVFTLEVRGARLMADEVVAACAATCRRSWWQLVTACCLLQTLQLQHSQRSRLPCGAAQVVPRHCRGQTDNWAQPLPVHAAADERCAAGHAAV